MKWILLLLTSIIIIMAESNAKTVSSVRFLNAQETKEPLSVKTAVAPIYPVLVLTTKIKDVETVKVTVEITAEGTVSTAKAISGIPTLSAISEQAALSWKFNPLPNSSISRVATLIFVFRIMPQKTPSKELVTLYIPPYNFEIRSPWFDTPTLRGSTIYPTLQNQRNHKKVQKKLR